MQIASVLSTNYLNKLQLLEYISKYLIKISETMQNVRRHVLGGGIYDQTSSYVRNIHIPVSSRCQNRAKIKR